MTDSERADFLKERDYKIFCNRFKDEIKTLKLLLKDSQGMTVLELEKIVKEKEYDLDMFVPYVYEYYGRTYKSTLKGTISKILKTLENNDVVIKTVNEKWILKENVLIDDNGMISFNDSFKYRQFVNTKFIDGVISSRTILENCGPKPTLEDVDLPQNATQISLDELESAKQAIEDHKTIKPLIFGRSKWEEEHHERIAKYNKLKNRYDDTKEQFAKYYQLLNEYESKVVSFCEKKIHDTRQTLKEQQFYWYKLSPYQFEIEVANLFSSLGYESMVTKASGDGGVDIVLKNSEIRIAVQCKAYKGLIGPNIVRELGGVVKRDKYHKGILVGLKGFTEGAKKEAKLLNVTLLDVNSLIALSKK